MVEADPIFVTIPLDYAGQRLDVALSQLLKQLSRSAIIQLIRNQKVFIAHRLKVKPSYRLQGGERIEVVLENYLEPSALKAQPIELDILYEDEDIIVLNKAAGMVVHPAPGNYQDTLVNALLYRFPKINTIGATERPGIVHRLDKDTSGVMVVAKTKVALNHLANQFQTRSLKKKYLALVWGVPKKDNGEITYPIGRHPIDRKKMSINSYKGRSAKTLWRIKASYHSISLLEIVLETGRTHQIRVHLTALNHPLVGDPVYGGKRNTQFLNRMPPVLRDQVTKIERQMLHAWQLTIVHPHTQKSLLFEAPIPADMLAVIETLRGLEKKLVE
jgi:23S rRNA pseudouridine1911/1915/1917 synthase